MVRLIRLLMVSYAAAAALGGTLFTMGSGMLAAVLGFWLGGAVIVLVLAVWQARGKEPAAALGDEAVDAALADALAAWEADRLADRPAPQRLAENG